MSGTEQQQGGWTSFRKSSALVGLLIISSVVACREEAPEKIALSPAVAETPTGASAIEAKPAKPEVKGPSIAEIAAWLAPRVADLVKKEADEIDRILANTADAHDAVVSMYPGYQLRYYAHDGNLTRDGLAVIDTLSELDRHGIDRRGYRLVQIDLVTQSTVDAFANERQTILALRQGPRAARVAAAISTWVRTGQGNELALVKAAEEALDGAQRKALFDHLPALFAASKKGRIAIWKADIEISRAVVRYVVDMLFGRPAHPLLYTTPNTIRHMLKTKSKEIIEKLQDSRGKTAEVMRALWPTHPQYMAILKAVDRYDALTDKGGWKTLPKMPSKKLKPGSSGAFVVAMRERLAAEGYEVELGKDVFDKALERSVSAFQERHHLHPDGVVGKSCVAEFNVPAAHRARQLRLALQRLRESNARDPNLKMFIYVNIAAQRMWLYQNGKVLRSHKVIVGKDSDDIDHSTRLKGKLNRTKLFTATLNKVTLAPRWYPTPRVIDLELGPALAKDPDYYEKHGYVSEMSPEGVERVYQKSGPSNLLGVVKFQFPNKHMIYMHDTPSRWLFRRSMRAYSHGCIRLHQPKKLAYLILGRERRGYTRKKIDEIIEEREEKIVFLKKKFRVHTDYVSAGVDSKGQVWFYSDLYGYDMAYFTGQLPVQEVEEYEPAKIEGT